MSVFLCHNVYLLFFSWRFLLILGITLFDSIASLHFNVVVFFFNKSSMMHVREVIWLMRSSTCWGQKTRLTNWRPTQWTWGRWDSQVTTLSERKQEFSIESFFFLGSATKILCPKKKSIYLAKNGILYLMSKMKRLENNVETFGVCHQTWPDPNQR